MFGEEESRTVDTCGPKSHIQQSYRYPVDIARNLENTGHTMSCIYAGLGAVDVTSTEVLEKSMPRAKV